jgi:hypothetical protein
MNSYIIFCQWCRDHGYAEPTPEWYMQALIDLALREGEAEANQREIDRERREGWAYDLR